MSKRAVIYARVSTSRQAEEELPIEGQVERCRQKAEDLGAEVVQEFIDEALSGGTDARPSFRDAIDYCELVSPDYLITWSTSRFVRSRYDAAIYKRRLQRAGVEIIFLNFPIDRSSPIAGLAEGMMELFDEYLITQVSADTKRSMLRLAEQGYYCGGRHPFGFVAQPCQDGKRKRLVPVVNEVEVVHHIFDLRESGLGAKSISDALNEAGHTNRGRRWSQRSVLNVLRSESLIGNVVFNRRDKVAGRDRPEDQWIRVKSHEAVIDPERFRAVQEMIREDSPARDTGSPLSRFLFTGLARCECGGSLQTETATGKSGKRYHYYFCRYARRGGDCAGRRLPAHALDDWLLELITARIFCRENLLEVYRELEGAVSGWARDRSRRLNRAHRKLSGLEERQERLFQVLEMHGRGAPDLSDLTDRLRANKREIARLEAEIAGIEAEDPPELAISEADLEELRDFLVGCLQDRAAVKRTRAFFREFIAEIVVLDDEVQIKYRPDRLVGADDRGVRSTAEWLGERDSNPR